MQRSETFTAGRISDHGIAVILQGAISEERVRCCAAFDW